MHDDEASGPVAILFGGAGPERHVSVASAQNLCERLAEAELWFWREDGSCSVVNASELRAHQRPFEIAFVPSSQPFAETIEQALSRASSEGRALVLALHGGEGEDGRLAALCEERGVAFTGSGSRASALAFNKELSKRRAAAAGVRTLASLILVPDATQFDDLFAVFRAEGGLVAKPVCDGSSHGLCFLTSEDLVEAFARGKRTCEYMVEPLIHGVESTVGVLETASGVRALPPVEIRLPAGANFDYTSKYLDARVQEICPPTFSATTVRALQEAAVAVHVAVGAAGYSRSDFITRDDNGAPIFLEINTLPGLTAASLFPRELAAEKISMREFLLAQIELGRKRRDNQV